MDKRQSYFSQRYREDPETGGWLWTGSRVNDTYGCANIDYKQLLAHRLSYELHHGPIPEGQHVCHRCDTPLCVNPAHLFLGTQKDNLEDMTQKGRRKAVPGFLGRSHSEGTRRKMAQARTRWWDARRKELRYGLSEGTPPGGGLTPGALRTYEGPGVHGGAPAEDVRSRQRTLAEEAGGNQPINDWFSLLLPPHPLYFFTRYRRIRRCKANTTTANGWRKTPAKPRRRLTNTSCARTRTSGSSLGLLRRRMTH